MAEHYLDRRSILAGGALAALVGAATPAEACSMEVRRPWEGRFWSQLWASHVVAPGRYRELANELIEAIAWGSAERLEPLFVPDARLFYPADGTRHWSHPGREFARGEAFSKLAKTIRRRGERRAELRYFGTLLPHMTFLVHARLHG